MKTHLKAADAAAALAILVAGAGLAQPAAAAVGDWGEGQKSQVRLIASGVADGRLAAAVEIVLPAGSDTYWRSPGDAGVVPELDFSASRNIGKVNVAFPVPVRENDGFAVTNVYHDHVVLLLDAPVADAAKPVTLALAAHIGVCDRICVPDDVTATLAIPPGENDVDAARLIAVAAAAIPAAAEPGRFALEKVARAGGTEGRPEVSVTGVVPEAATADVFVEGPEGWAPYVPDFVGEEGGRATYRIKFSRLGSPVPVAGAALRFTIRSGDRAIDQTLVLP